jgi:hypothetical protein
LAASSLTKSPQQVLELKISRTGQGGEERAHIRVSPPRSTPIAAPAHIPQPGGAGSSARPGQATSSPRSAASGRNRAQLYLWRAGFDAGVEAAGRNDAGVFAADLHRAAAERQREIHAAFEAGRRAQARTDLGTIATALRREAAARQLELLDEVIGVLARAMMDSHHARPQRSTPAAPSIDSHLGGRPDATSAGQRAADPAEGSDAAPTDAYGPPRRPSTAQLRCATAAEMQPRQPSRPPQPTRGGRRQVA